MRLPRWAATLLATAGGLVLVVVVAFAAIGVVSVLARTEPSATQSDRVFADFSSSQLQVTNDGTPLGALDTGRNASGLRVVDSELTHGAPTAPNAAGYLQAHIGEPVSRIGAVAEFHAPNSGAVGLLASADSIAEDSGAGVADRLPDTGMLFAATNRHWHFSVWDAARGEMDVLLDGTLALPGDGRPLAFEVVRHVDSVTIRLPDGTMHATADARIAEWTGPWAYWQLYELDTAQVPATVTAVWAS